MPFADKEKAREYRQQYYLKNKEKSKCEHNRKKSICRDCGGVGICEHNQYKTRCKICGGGSLCEHNRFRSRCKECFGGSICEHNKDRTQCIDCGGSSICEHNRQKAGCRDCGGSSICCHNRYKSLCKDCQGSGICEHNRQKSQCRDCGLCLCEHDKRKNQCKECSPYLYIVILQRQHLRKIFGQTNIEKIKPSIEYLGCSSEYFRNYIQSKLKEGMTFHNIHFDHIKPISAFNLEDEDELLNCCHYTNFQPLLANDNLMKSNKWSEEDEVFWNENIKGKEYLPIYMPR